MPLVVCGGPAVVRASCVVATVVGPSVVYTSVVVGASVYITVVGCEGTEKKKEACSYLNSKRFLRFFNELRVKVSFSKINYNY